MITIEYLRLARIGPFTIFDTGTAFLGVLVVSPLLSWLAGKAGWKVPITSWLLLTMPVSVIFHLVFKQDTPLMKMLSNPQSIEFCFVIAALLLMIYFAIKKMSKVG